MFFIYGQATRDFVLSLSPKGLPGWKRWSVCNCYWSVLYIFDWHSSFLINTSNPAQANTIYHFVNPSLRLDPSNIQRVSSQASLQIFFIGSHSKAVGGRRGGKLGYRWKLLKFYPIFSLLLFNSFHSVYPLIVISP